MPAYPSLPTNASLSVCLINNLTFRLLHNNTAHCSPSCSAKPVRAALTRYGRGGRALAYCFQQLKRKQGAGGLAQHKPVSAGRGPEHTEY
ncbi:unnamed protein product [Gadus morhua 'NCC']